MTEIRANRQLADQNDQAWRLSLLFVQSQS